MTDPDVRVRIEGVDVTQERLERLLRRRAQVERRSRELLRELERVERGLRRIEEAVGRA